MTHLVRAAALIHYPDVARASGLAALIATHNLDLAQRMDRQVTIRDGHVVPLDERA